MNKDDLRKWRFIGGLEESSKPAIPEKKELIEESVTETVEETTTEVEVIEEEATSKEAADETLVAESEKVDFSEKAASGLSELEKAITSKGGKNVTLAQGKEGLEDLQALSLKQVARVVDMGKLVYKVFSDPKGHLWFLDGSDSGSIKQTSLTMDELRKFNKDAGDVKMREEKSAKKDKDDDSSSD